MKFIAALACLALLCIGCNPEDASELKRDAGALAKTTGKVLSNGQLAARVNGALANTKDIDMKGLHIEAKEGVVTIGGHVASAAEKKRVLDTTKNVKGVSQVVDQLRIESK
jgi:osmotically-inducible protein OsmY